MFKLPDEVKEGIKGYRNSLDDLQSGKTSPARFTGIRVPWGIYSHRGGKVFMNRIRIPAGQVTSGQLEAIAHCARAYGNGMTHITTRQDIQLHAIKIEDTIKVIEYLKDYELSPRGGGGNTVRNVTACAYAGICKEEVFDVGAYAVSLSEELLARDTSYNLPRKFKIGFSGCAKDCAAILVNDAGFLAKEKNKQKGFQVFVGGGMGAEPLVGNLLEEFIPQDELGFCVAAIKSVFYKKGDRRNKHHNRLRFLIQDSGMALFRQWYREELKSIKETEYIVLRNIEQSEPSGNRAGKIPKTEDKDFNAFLKHSLLEQRQDGLVSIELRVPRGDISAASLEALAALGNDFGEIEFRTSGNQNLCLCNVKKKDVYALFLKLKQFLKNFLYPATLQDVVCCKGALTCNLGLCNSPGLTEKLEEVIKDNFIGKAALGKLNIKINGCPNACGQHPLGLIALHGMVRRVSGRPVPFYKLLLGGRKGVPHTKLAGDSGIILPAKNIPLFIKDFVNSVNSAIDEDTDIYNYIDNYGEGLAKEIAAKYAYVPGYLENKDYYIDWGKESEFSLDGLGPGECGAGVIDMIEADLSDARIHLEAAVKDKHNPEEISKLLFFSSRALLVVRGADPKDELTAIGDFIEKFINAGMSDPKFSNLREMYDSLSGSLSPKEKEEKFLYAKEFFVHVKELYKNMEPSFSFPKYTPLETIGQPEKRKMSQAQQAEESRADAVLDLKGVQCPMNYVQAKLYLENVKIGQIVELSLDEGEPLENVPASLKNDGQEIMEIKKADGYYKVLVKKLVDS